MLQKQKFVNIVKDTVTPVFIEKRERTMKKTNLFKGSLRTSELARRC